MPTEDSNRALVARTLSGDASAAELLVRRHLRAAYAVALAVLRDASEAEDVAQEAFALALERLDTCREPERFAGWLLQIVRRRALDVLHRVRLRGPLLGLDAAENVSVRGGAEGSALRAQILSAMASLPPIQREVVLLHDLEGWTHAEIGSALEITEVASRQHLFQARKTLRALLRGSPAEASDGS
jgi:RNA polymerase sigma-70 factor (ECF subfamily)